MWQIYKKYPINSIIQQKKLYNHKLITTMHQQKFENILQRIEVF